MDLEKLGWKNYFKTLPVSMQASTNSIARVAVENKTNYLLYTAEGELSGILRGKFLKINRKANLPKVGDWVKITRLQGEKKAVIESILPRHTVIARKQVEARKLGSRDEEQIIAANVDSAFIVCGLDRDFEPKRLQRYIMIAKAGGVTPIIVLNKSDISSNLEKQIALAKKVASSSKILLTSAVNEEGISEIQKLIIPKQTFVFMGSSGAGKSTLINALMGEELQKTQAVRLTDSHGRHTTTKREMFVLPNGGILIDTPGMREVGGITGTDVLDNGFTNFKKLSLACKFRNCDHKKSAGCAILASFKGKDATENNYKNFLKLKRELDRQDTSKKSFKTWAQKEKRKTAQRRFSKLYKK